PGGDLTPRNLPHLDTATLVVGPEGGLSEQDLNVLEQADFRGLRLGPRILRTETAGLAAITALQAIHGDI
ncbi:MAG: RsmE family RNA methyltransferase, partial [Xanthomonadales bacterium]|nr:RsmE family RNA methyltransferase [Xanthomonadales bacterium]MCB1577344.1 RsmE family RNA methyltransferase [Xanthomonadales bacterium]